MLKTADQVQALAENKGATLAIVGAYYVQGSDFQFQARVMDARRSRLLYAVPPVSGPRGEPDRLVEALKQRVMGFVGMYFDPGFNVLLMSHVPTYDAYREYTAAWELYGFDYAGAINRLQRAMELDPDFMFPELMLASAYGNLGDHQASQTVNDRLQAHRDQLTEYERLFVDRGGAVGEGNFLKALEYLHRAEKMDRRSFVVNYLIGLSNYQLARLQDTIETFRHRPLTERDLRYPSTTWRYGPLTQALHGLGRYEEERQAAVDGQRSLPHSVPYRGHTARALVGLNQLDELRRFVDQTMAQPGASTAGGGFLLDIAYELRAHGRPEEAAKIANRAATWYRSRPSDVAGQPASHYALARALDLVGRRDEAQKVLADLVTRSPENIDYKGALGAMAARSGDRPAAARIADELVAFHRPFLYGRHTYWRACIAAALGEKDAAVDLLRESFAQGRPYSIDLHRDPSLEALRGYPPYEELVRPQSR